MRFTLALALFAALSPAVVLAQTATAPQAAPPSATAPPSAAPPSGAAPEAKGPRARGGNITRDEYIERAKRNAEKRFDRLDTDHDGILTPEERAAGRGTRRSSKSQ
jgi:hypothetical protein